MVSEEFIQRCLLSFLSWYHSESDVYNLACRLTQMMYPQYAEMACLENIPNKEVQREIQTHVYYPDALPPIPGIILVSGSSPANSDSMIERKDLFLKNGFSVMILDSFTRARTLEDCFRKDVPCNTYQQLSGNYWNNTTPPPQYCPTINIPTTNRVESELLKTYLDRITAGAIFSPAERAHDLYEALRIFRANEKVDSNNIAIIGYSHGGSTVLESLTFSGNKVPPPGDDAYSSEEHSLHGVKAAVAYYPNCRPGTYFDWHASIKNIDLQIHLADRDEYVRPDLCQLVIDRIKKSHNDQKLQTHHYDELHAFDMKEYGAAYSKKSKELAFNRTLGFIRNAFDPKYQ